MDFIAATLSLLGAGIIAKDVRLATIIWIVSNLLYIVWSYQQEIYSINLQNVGFLLINTITLIIRWRKP